MVICLERGADQNSPAGATTTCFGKIQTGFTFLVPAYMGSSGQTAVIIVVFNGFLQFFNYLRLLIY